MSHGKQQPAGDDYLLTDVVRQINGPHPSHDDASNSRAPANYATRRRVRGATALRRGPSLAQPRPLRPETGAGRRSLLGRPTERPLFSALGRVFVVRPQTALTPPGGSLQCGCGRRRVSVIALRECTRRVRVRRTTVAAVLWKSFFGDRRE